MNGRFNKNTVFLTFWVYLGFLHLESIVASCAKLQVTESQKTPLCVVLFVWKDTANTSVWVGVENRVLSFYSILHRKNLENHKTRILVNQVLQRFFAAQHGRCFFDRVEDCIENRLLDTQNNQKILWRIGRKSVCDSFQRYSCLLVFVCVVPWCGGLAAERHEY